MPVFFLACLFCLLDCFFVCLIVFLMLVCWQASICCFSHACVLAGQHLHRFSDGRRALLRSTPVDPIRLVASTEDVFGDRVRCCDGIRRATRVRGCAQGSAGWWRKRCRLAEADSVVVGLHIFYSWYVNPYFMACARQSYAARQQT